MARHAHVAGCRATACTARPRGASISRTLRLMLAVRLLAPYETTHRVGRAHAFGWSVIGKGNIMPWPLVWLLVGALIGLAGPAGAQTSASMAGDRTRAAAELRNTAAVL